MAKLSILAGATSQTVNIFVQNSASTTGAGLTGLVYNTSGLTAYYVLPRAAAAAISLATLASASAAWSSGGFFEIDSTHCPGLYRLDLPNAVLAAASGRFVTVYLQGAANMAPLLLEIELTGWDNQDGAHGGMSALPNAAAGAVGGVPLAVDTNGRVDVLKVNGTAQTAKDLGASATQTGDTYARLGAPAGASTAADIAAMKTDLDGGVKVSVGTGAGQINVSGGKVPATVAAADVSGNPAVNAAQFGGQTVTAAAGVTVPSSIASPTNITAGTITTVTNLTNAATNGDLTAAMKASVTTAATAATPTAAAVTGAVGSVTAPVSVTGDLTAAMKASVTTAATAATPTVTVSGDLTATMKASVTTAATAATPTAAAVTGAVGSVTAPVSVTGDLTAAMKASVTTAVWDAATSAHQTAGSTGKALTTASSAGDPWSTAVPGSYTAGTAGYVLGNLSTAADPWSTALPGAYPAGTAGYAIGNNLNAKVGDVKAKTDNLPASPAATGAQMDLVNAPNATAAAAIAGKVWDTAIAGHETAGSAGASLASASSSGDPWSTPLPGSYGPGTAGRIVGGTPNTYAQQGSGDTELIGQ